MNKFSDFLLSGIKNLGIPLIFGIYHKYTMDLEDKHQKEIIDLKNKLIFEEVARKIIEEKLKSSWW